MSPYIGAVGISSVVSIRRGVYRDLLAKLEGKRPIGRQRNRCEINNVINFQVLGCGCVNWNELAPDRDERRVLVNVITKLRFQ